MAIVSGIYIILNTKNGKVYLGQASNIRRRWIEHRSKLNHNKHDNRHLQHAWNKYGAKAFKFQILEYCSVDQLNERETHHISIYKARKLAYNDTDGGGGASGYKWTDEQKQNYSTKRKGIQFSDEHRANISLSGKARLETEPHVRLGMKHTPEAIEKMRQSHTGKTLNVDHAKRSADRAAEWADPVIRAKRIAGVKAAWAKRKGLNNDEDV